jgi:hypothetical protein
MKGLTRASSRWRYFRPAKRTKSGRMYGEADRPEVDLHRPGEDPGAGQARGGLGRFREPADARTRDRARPRRGFLEAHAGAVWEAAAAVESSRRSCESLRTILFTLLLVCPSNAQRDIQSLTVGLAPTVSDAVIPISIWYDVALSPQGPKQPDTFVALRIKGGKVTVVRQPKRSSAAGRDSA